MWAPVRAAGGVSGDGDLLGAGVGAGVPEKQSRSPQNLPGRGGWSWVGQAGAIPGFRGGRSVGVLVSGHRGAPTSPLL